MENGSSTVSAIRYRAFISYSHADKTWGDWLHKVLETYRVPSRLVGRETAAGTIPRRLAPIFRDRDELASAHDLGNKVNEALGQSEALIVICSPRSAASRWVNEEVLAFKRTGRTERIFCLIVDGEPDASDKPGREAEECFCPALRFTLDANGQPTSERTEPIAADARPGKDGKANAKLKLIAGMLDVGFDALKQREQHRKMQRMVAVTSLALAVMAVTVVLAVFALISRHHAVIAKHQAVVAQQAAVRRQKQAEGLVGFMLGDLNDKLAQVSRLDIMQAVDDKAMAYFESLPTTDVTDEALEQRAKALEKIGSVRMDQGHLSAARESYRAAAKLAGKLADEAPEDSARQIAYGRILDFIGTTYVYQGNMNAALRNFQAAQEILEKAQARAAGDLTLLFELATLDNNIGHVLEARGRLDEATVQYRKTLVLMQKLVAAKPDNTEWTQQLGGAHNNLGKMALMHGDLATAVAEYRADDAIETDLSKHQPKDINQRENVLRVRAILGRTLALTGDSETGMRDLQQAVEIATQLLTVDPHNTGFGKHAALYSTQLAQLQRLGGDLPAAQALVKRSLTILGAMTKKDPANAYWQQDYAEAFIEQAAQSLAAGQSDAARAQAQTALAILDPLFAKQPDDRSLLLDTVTAKLLLADASGDAPTAQRLRNEALQAMHAVKTGQGDPRLLALRAEALLALNRKADARPLLKRLWNTGYRDPALLVVLRREHIDYPVNAEFSKRIEAIMQTDANNPPHPPGAARLPPSPQRGEGGRRPGEGE
ncbi:MAG: TIR domain-containing protein [Gammaproteobacteria bacterium]